MPRLNSPLGLSSRPLSVALGELAIAAGLAGQSLTLSYDGYPATALCDIWRYYAAAIGTASILQIRTKADVKTLQAKIADTRVAIVHSARLYDHSAWIVQMASLEADQPSPRPALLCGFAHDDPDSDPGLTLAITYNEAEKDAVRRWLVGRNNGSAVCEVAVPAAIEFDPRLTGLLEHLAQQTSGRGIELRELRVLRAFLVGAGILRSSAQQHSAATAALVDLHEYRFVRTLLCSSVVRPHREFCDPLALDMVNRANVYLSIKYGGGRPNPFPIEEDGRYRSPGGSPTRREFVTRREMADLGNVDSGVVRRLIECLQGKRDGYDVYLRVGLVGPSIASRDWRRLAPGELARRLRPWSVKQIRTHFDRLRETGLVGAERESGNGPWQYQIPEALGNVTSPFAQLPTAQDLARAAP